MLNNRCNPYRMKNVKMAFPFMAVMPICRGSEWIVSKRVTVHIVKNKVQTLKSTPTLTAHTWGKRFRGFALGTAEAGDGCTGGETAGWAGDGACRFVSWPAAGARATGGASTFSVIPYQESQINFSDNLYATLCTSNNKNWSVLNVLCIFSFQ